MKPDIKFNENRHTSDDKRCEKKNRIKRKKSESGRKNGAKDTKGDDWSSLDSEASGGEKEKRSSQRGRRDRSKHTHLQESYSSELASSDEQDQRSSRRHVSHSRWKKRWKGSRRSPTYLQKR